MNLFESGFSELLGENDGRSQKLQGPRLGVTSLHLPGEITDIIISYVDDNSTLCSCMRVCREWAPASRAVLFEEISIKSPSSYDLLVQRVLHSASLKSYLQYTRTFRIDPLYPDPVAHSCLLFWDMAGHLPALRTLTLGSLDWSKQGQGPRATEPLLLSQFGQLRRLSLRDCRMLSFNYLRRVLTAAPWLYDLSLFHVTWPSVPPLNPFFPQIYQRPAFGRLSIYFAIQDAVTDSLFSWLSQTRFEPNFGHISERSYPIPLRRRDEPLSQGERHQFLEDT
ncbi:hypothetical protein L227DRAFT_574411 [Lentinus tigrinus ALCF2SS1-6]|uniref:F-box domain-containing protein n=1 Tax=Lentinus tigrinus ALCF2SS1-6 TaxID=1328759 RepID=A0A5C2SC55_9APHY|nr:hypothetical protein L227DRAFT_574411 [Lentinus tigrinus ALCF2SS1-6]